jgi:hypothetical protein
MADDLPAPQVFFAPSRSKSFNRPQSHNASSALGFSFGGVVAPNINQLLT